MAPTTTTPQPMIGRYEVVAKLGEGGMAETWLCRLRGTRGFVRRVVVKTLKTEHLDVPEFHTMFADEARVGAALEHPNIPRVEELGEHGGLPYMVQEYVEGPSLYQMLKQQRRLGSLDHRVTARIVADVARALEHAWTSTDGDGQPLHVVHRDVSPSNILISVKGPSKLIDFGVARFADRETRTEAGVLKGKLRYMA
ncbi:MAG: serine/threonine protein kinase, partial [Myxococcales bacterium]|nr:serine/threonine protein kinase [Myxococcales bacterium]